VCGMLNQLNLRLFLNCNVNVNVNVNKMITVILEVNKHLFKYCILLQTDFQTRVFGYLKTCVWNLIICVWIWSLLGIKGHPCCPNEATQLINYLMHN